MGVLLITLTGCWYYASSLDDEIEAKQNEKQGKDAQVAKLKEQVKSVEDFEAKKKQLEAKNRIIDELEKSDRTGKVLDHVSQSLNPLSKSGLCECL